MKDIMLKITGKTVHNDDGKETQEDVIEFITEGRYARRGAITRISYEESEFSGMDGCRTLLTISDGKVRMQREGGDVPENTAMVFMKGRRYSGTYQTPFGPVGMEILTNDVQGAPLSEDGGKLSIDYSISLKGLMEARNRIDIEILQGAPDAGEPEQGDPKLN